MHFRQSNTQQGMDDAFPSCLPTSGEITSLNFGGAFLRVPHVALDHSQPTRAIYSTRFRYPSGEPVSTILSSTLWSISNRRA